MAWTTRNAAQIHLSDVLLKKFLGIRPELEVVHVSFDPLVGVASVLLRGEGLPDWPEAHVPLVVPITDVSKKKGK